jgi:hypothetical protein
VDRDNRSNVYEFSAMPPGETAQPVIVRESEGSSPAQMRIDEPRVPSDNEAFQAMRTDGLIEWLKEDTRRDSAASRATLAAARQEGELQRALQSQPDAIIKSLDQIRSFEHKLTTSQRGNTYTFRTQAWSVHSREHAKYIFFVKQTGDFSAKQAFFSDREQDRGRFAAHYNLENESMKWQESSDPVWNAKAKRVNEAVELPAGEHSPPTTLNAQQVSSSLNWQLTGTVGFSGPAPQGQIAGGVSITDSFTYNVNDVSVLNQSNSKAGAANAAWDFEIGEPNVSKGLCVSGITISNVPLVSRSTFSPTVEWIWRVDNSLRTIHSIYQRGFPFKVTFRTGLKHIYQTGLCGIERWSEDYEESHLIWLPWSS